MNNIERATQSQADLEHLQLIYRTNTAFRAVLDYVGQRAGNMGETTVNSVEENITGHRLNDPRADIISVFRQLEKSNYGRFIVGRKGNTSRFKWSENPRKVRRLAQGQESIVDAQHSGDFRKTSKVIDHRFQLRPDFELVLTLPVDLSPSEASRVSDFVKTLPFDDTRSTEIE